TSFLSGVSSCMSMALRRFGLLLLTLLAIPCALADEAAIMTIPPLYQGAFISGVTPSQFSPDGGQIFTILGGGFRTPVRVFLDLGDGATPLEVFVVSLTTTAIEVVTPKVDVAPRGWRSASV